MRDLANCSPREFLTQTNKIRHAVGRWLDLTRVMEIRKEMPNLTGNESKEEKQAAVLAQVQRNASRMLDAMLEEHPDETVELLGLLCFVEPEEVDDHPMYEYLGCVREMLERPEVIGFFMSLMRLAQTGGSASAKASG